MKNALNFLKLKKLKIKIEIELMQKLNTELVINGTWGVVSTYLIELEVSI